MTAKIPSPSSLLLALRGCNVDTACAACVSLAYIGLGTAGSVPHTCAEPEGALQRITELLAVTELYESEVLWDE